MSLQYLEALKQIGASPSTKFVVPMELSGLVAGHGDARRTGGQRVGNPRGAEATSRSEDRRVTHGARAGAEEPRRPSRCRQP